MVTLVAPQRLQAVKYWTFDGLNDEGVPLILIGNLDLLELIG